MRGKHGAQAAKRRAETAAETVDELRRTLNAERLAWKEERAELMGEAQSLRGRLNSDVNSLADGRVQEANDSARLVASEKDAQFRDRVVRLFGILTTPRLKELLGDDVLADVAETLGQKIGDVMPDSFTSADRNWRRATNAGTKKANHALRERLRIQGW